MDGETFRFDVVIVGAGHNGLVAASYLGLAGLSILLLERDAVVGGAARSARVFPGVDAHISMYAYLVSLFPQKIVEDLKLPLQLAPRRIASFTPNPDAPERGLLIEPGKPDRTRVSFHDLTGSDRDFHGYARMQARQERIARHLWPSLLEPLRDRSSFTRELDAEDRATWTALFDEPIGAWIESHLDHDLVRGLVATDALIGVPAALDDPALVPNRTYLYHIIGGGTGAWHTPIGGMGALTASLLERAREAGAVLRTRARVTAVHAGPGEHEIQYEFEGVPRVALARYVLRNDARPATSTPGAEGSAFKINLLLNRLPALRTAGVCPGEAFTGTFHANEGYAKMTADLERALAGDMATVPACEFYCHSLSDPSILGDELRHAGAHTLTCFGLDMPYRLFTDHPDAARAEALARTLAGVNQLLAEPIEDCLATDENGQPCIEAKSAYDLEAELGLPQGNIFHRPLQWPFAEDESELGTWGVETADERVFLCGASAKRGGCVSGIPGHNAAQKVLELERIRTG